MKIPIVNNNDEIINHKERTEIKPSDIFRTASLWVENSNGEVLLAQRKLTKKIDPGKWSEAVGGTVEQDDSYIDTILREAEEEIGLFNPKLEDGPKQYYSGSYQAFTKWFKTIVNKDFKPKIQENEVESTKWISKNDLLKDLQNNPDNYIESMGEVVDLFLR